MRRSGFTLREIVRVVPVALLVAGCVHKYAIPRAAESRNLVHAAANVYVATPADGQDDRPRTYQGSGAWTASAIAGALRNRGAAVIVGGPANDPLEAVEEARTAGANLLAYPRITHWSDRLTEWSGIPDRITLQIGVYDVDTGTMLDHQEIRAASRWATFGGDHPQELLPELTRRWSETLLQ